MRGYCGPCSPSQAIRRKEERRKATDMSTRRKNPKRKVAPTALQSREERRRGRAEEGRGGGGLGKGGWRVGRGSYWTSNNVEERTK